MNKAELIDALSERLGDKKVAAAAVDGLVDVVVRTVNKGDKVTITGFGVFEKRARSARTARNPRTGESVRVKKTNVPAFRAGTTFREVVSGARKLPKVAAARSGSTARATATPARSTSTRTTTRPTTARATATKTGARTTAKSTAASKATKATARTATKSTKAAPKAAPKKTAVKKTTARKKA